MNPSPRTPSTALPLALLLGLLLLGAFLVLRSEDPNLATPEPTPLPSPLVEAGRAGADLDGPAVAVELDPGLAPSSSRAELPTARAGVRLAGEGQLTGVVLARDAAAGVGDVRIDLYAFPPMGAEVLGRVLRLANTGPDFADRARPVATTRTAPDGSFSFEGVRAGRYFAEARGDFAIPDPIEDVLVAASGEGGPAVLHVRAGGRLTGQVLDPSGRPVAGALVLSGQGEGVFLDSLRTGDSIARRTSTDASGRFELGGMPPGPGFRVTAVSEQHGLAFVRGVDVVAGAEREVDLRFPTPGWVEGQVLSVRAADEDGGEQRVEPLAGASVSAVSRGLRELFYTEEILAMSAATTDAEGRYRLGPVPVGSIDVLAWAPGHLAGHEGPVLVAAGVVADGGVLELETGPLASGRVVDPEGLPIPGVQVRWMPTDLRQNREFTLAPLLSQGLEGFEFPTTDADGRFTAGPFPGEPGGRGHRLDFFKAGFAQASARWQPGGPELEVVMHRGGAVEGIVVDSAGRRPVTRFTISGNDRLEEAAGTPGAWNPFSGGQLVEDPKGRFRVDAVRAGQRDLFVSAPGYRTRAVRGLDVVEGEVLRGVIVNLERGHTIAGVVVDGDGEPVAGARVAATSGSDAIARADRDARAGRGQQPDPLEMREFSARMPAGALAFGMGMGFVESEVSAEDGSFELVGLGEGTWTLHATHRDYASGSSEPVRLEGRPEDLPEAGAEGAPSATATVVMSAGSRLHGRVTDRFDRPVEGVLVVAFSPGIFATGKTAGGAYQAETRRDGSYSIDHMVAGGYFLLVTRGNEALDLLSFLGTMQFELVTVPEGRDLEFDLVDQSAATTRVHGLVLEADEPVSGGTLIALALEAENMLGVDVKVAAVGPDGAYEFPGLAEGPYQFRYEARGRRAVLEVDVPDRPDVRIDHQLPSGRVEGRVLDGLSGEPVERAVLTLRSLDGGVELGGLIGSLVGDSLSVSYGRTDRDGSFSFPGLAPGSYELLATGPRRGSAGAAYGPAPAVEVTITEGGPATFAELELPPTLAIRGSVLDAQGDPVAGARLAARRPEAAELPRQTKAGADGTFELLGVGTGSYRVSVQASGYATLAGLEVEVGEDGAELEVVLQAGVPVRVRVLGPDGQPVLGAVADLEPAGGAAVDEQVDEALETWFAGRGVAGADGLVELGRFAPGDYDLVVSRGARRVLLEGVEVPEVGELELEAILP